MRGKDCNKNSTSKRLLEKLRKIKILKALPNIVTCFRIGLSIYAASSFIVGNFIPAIFSYIIAGFTDLVDGALARGLDAQSELGRKLDALSDKIYAASFIIPALVANNYIMLIPLVFEGAISVINMVGHMLGFKSETQRIGKIKTCFLFPTMIVGLLSTLPYELGLPLGVSIKPWDMILWMGPLMVATTSLQYNSIITYLNLLHKNLNSKSSNDSEDIIPVKEKPREKEGPAAIREEREMMPKERSSKRFAYIHNIAACTTTEVATYIYYQTPLEKPADNDTNKYILGTLHKVKKLMRERRR